MDRWQTFSVIPSGGLIENLSPLIQGEQFPGSLIDARNFEPSPIGGYRRIKGFEKFDTALVGGVTTKIDAVFMLGGTCLALQAKKWYSSAGSGWTLLHTLSLDPVNVLATRYNWSGTDSIIIVDGANAPIHFDGTTLTEMVVGGGSVSIDGGSNISGTTAANILGAQAVQEFHGHMFYSVGEYIRFSAPEDAGVVTGSGGSGEFVTGSEKIALAPWRDQLYCWGDDRIGKITGQNSSNFIYENVTHRVGTVSAQTVQEMNGDVYFMAFDGVRTIAGTDRNDDVELGATTRTIPNTIENLGFRSSSVDTHAVPVRNSTQYRLFVGSSVIDDADGEGILGGVRTETHEKIDLEWFKLKGINASCSDSSVYTNNEYVVHGTYGGYVMRQEQGTDFDGVAIDSIIQFPYWSMGTPEVRKTIYKGKFYLRSISLIEPVLNYNFDYNLDGALQPPSIALSTGADGYDEFGSSLYGTATYGSDFPINADLQLIGSGNNVSFSLSSNDTLAVWSCQSLVIEYGLDGRR